MAEFIWETNPTRPSLRRAVRHQSRSLERAFRIVAENFLAAESRIDLLGVGDEGELVSLRIGASEEDDAALLTRCLSDLAWLRERAEDLRKLVPDLGIETSAEPRAILLCPAFQLETRRAVEMLPAGSVELIRYRCYRMRGQLTAVFEDGEASVRLEADRVAPIPRSAAPTEERASPEPSPQRASQSGFRTGLVDAQLRLEPVDPADLD